MYVREQPMQRQLPTPPVKPQSASAPKTPPPQYNPHAPNTAATQYQTGCGGCGKATRSPTPEELAAHEKRIMQMQQAQFQNAVSKGCGGG
jgi:hypothetical protein